jgi:chromosome segregation and condensation protein ScpB
MDKKLLKEKSVLKLSPSTLETLAIIAYKHSITQAEALNLQGLSTLFLIGN